MVLRIASRCRSAAGGRLVQLGIYLVSMLALFALAAHAAGRLASMAASVAPAMDSIGDAGNTKEVRPSIAKPHAVAMSIPPARSQGSVTLAQSWYEDLSRHSYWRDRPRRRDRYERRDRDDRGWWDDEDDRDYDDHALEPNGYFSGTYRTVCVRLCDGFYWPISFATTREHFGNDSRKCEASCGSPARLYVYPNPGGGPENMQGLDGQPYGKLEAAFLYRTQFNAACKCKPDPWSPEARNQHRTYALEARKRKGDKAAAKQLRELRAGQRAMRVRGGTSSRASEASGSEQAVASETAIVPPEPRGSARSRDDRRMSLGAGSAPAPKASTLRPMGSWGDWSKSSP